MPTWNRGLSLQSHFFQASTPKASRVQQFQFQFQRHLSIASRKPLQRPTPTWLRLPISYPLRYNSTQAVVIPKQGSSSNSIPDANLSAEVQKSIQWKGISNASFVDRKAEEEEETTASSKSISATRSADENLSPQQPVYELTFTCRPCQARSTHRISKHGYHKGSVLIACPDCKSRHVISDHLRIFSEDKVTLEELLAKNGEVLKKGMLNQDGDIEIWDDGSGRYVTPEATPEENFRDLGQGNRHKPD